MRQVTNDERITAATTLPLVPASADLAVDVCSALVLAWQVTQPDVRVPTIYVIADDVGNYLAGAIVGTGACEKARAIEG